MTEPGPRSPRLAAAEQLLDERGVGLAGARVAVGRSGIAAGFPRDPVLHLSWWVLGAPALLLLVRLLRRKAE